MAEVVAFISIPGAYMSLPKILLMFLLLVPWVIVLPWIQRDARQVEASDAMWVTLVLAVGAVATMLWLMLPLYIVSLLAYVAITGGVLIAYIAYRNGRVSPELKILTPSHLLGMFSGKSKIQVLTKVKVYRPNGQIVIEPDETSDPIERKMYNAAQDFFYDILWHRASQADLSPTGKDVRLRYVIDGVVSKQPTMSLTDSEALIQYVKSMAYMDVEDRRRPQKAKISLDMAGLMTEADLLTTGTTGGQRMQVRIVQQVVRTDLDTLGMADDTLRQIKEINKSSKGLIIIAGQAGNGVTSTLYSLLRVHDAFMHQLVTLESSEVVDMENITQNIYGPTAALTKAAAAALRRDPDVLMVDQCTDADTARLLTKAASNKTVLLGIKANNSFSALSQWVRLCGGAEAVQPLLAVACQMLVRKLCPSCREAYRPDPAMLTKANLQAENVDRFYRPPTQPVTDNKGKSTQCPACQGSGYLDRTAVFELLVMTDEIRKLIAEGGTLSQIKSAARKNKMLYMQEHAIQKVTEGITSIQEVIRVSQPAKKSSQ